jgi:hypothetical protein
MKPFKEAMSKAGLLRSKSGIGCTCSKPEKGRSVCIACCAKGQKEPDAIRARVGSCGWERRLCLPKRWWAATANGFLNNEHPYRFLKQDLFWTKVRVRTAEQFERRSIVVATAMNQLVVARDLGHALYRPWERRRHVLTSRQIRRVMPAILQQLGTSTRMPKPRGKAPGWPKGRPRSKPARFEVRKKLGLHCLLAAYLALWRPGIVSLGRFFT